MTWSPLGLWEIYNILQLQLTLYNLQKMHFHHSNTAPILLFPTQWMLPHLLTDHVSLDTICQTRGSNHPADIVTTAAQRGEVGTRGYKTHYREILIFFQGTKQAKEATNGQQPHTKRKEQQHITGGTRKNIKERHYKCLRRNFRRDPLIREIILLFESRSNC